MIARRSRVANTPPAALTVPEGATLSAPQPEPDLLSLSEPDRSVQIRAEITESRG